ncbi:unnamed protein product [Ilex paraguariensis]|uniref:Uncharacterized protein n=1 Tax=Ilex paraguariensis TaxID=185542 RepID=A0ABC8V1K7_9AQUA
MAEKNQQVYPLAPATEGPRSDVESSYFAIQGASKEEKIEMLRLYCFTVIILVFALTVMRIKSPKVRLGAVTIDTVGDSVRITAQVTGSLVIPEGRAKARSTKKVYINAELLPSNTGNGVFGADKPS